MCTSIVEIVTVEGMGKGGDGEWFDLTSVVVSYDHPHHAPYADSINIDFLNLTLGPSARTGVEISLATAREFAIALQKAITAAETEEKAASDWRTPAAS